MSTVVIRRSGAAGSFSNTGLAIAVALLVLPIAWGILTALKPEADAFNNSLGSFTHATQFGNFVTAWDYGPFGRFLLNGLVVACRRRAPDVDDVVAVRLRLRPPALPWPGEVVLCLCGNSGHPPRSPGGPYVPPHEGPPLGQLLPSIDRPWAFSAFGVFLMRQFFRSIPLELEDAAKVDGASAPVDLLAVMVPMVRPAIGVLGLFTFIAYWNAFLWPLIVINSRDLATVPLGLQFFLSQQGYQWNLLMAGGTISIVPGLILAFVLQRYLSEGISLTGIGGR